MDGTGPDRFGRAILIAAGLEVLVLGSLVLAPSPPAPLPPAVVQLKLLAPAPVAKAPPAPAKPAPTPVPPVTRPVPRPVPPSRPRAMHRVIQRVIHTPPQPPPPMQAMPAPVAAAPPVSQLAQQTVMNRYTGEVAAIVDGNLVIPQELLDAGLAGDCTLVFTLGPDGAILSADILTRSGLQAVNQAALAALQASHLPAFLPGMPAGPHVFTLPVHVGAAAQD